MEGILEKGAFRHPKDGKTYLVLGEFVHSETNEPFVVYSTIPGGEARSCPKSQFRNDPSWLCATSYTEPDTHHGVSYYRHFKGGEYLYLGEYRDTRTGEALVAYVPQYGARTPMVRPAKMFHEHVVKPKHNYEGPRFAFVRVLT